MTDNTKNNIEQHPNFPSGEWEGFYIYGSGPGAAQHPMHFTLEFKEGKVHGGGGDDIGSFTWDGTYDVEAMQCTMTKTYATHQVFYQGHVDENGVWGQWRIFNRGGFHIWPKGRGASNQAVEVKKVELKIVAENPDLK